MTRRGRWPNPGTCGPHAGRCPIPGWPRSTRSPCRRGDDPELDTLILRLHTETACRRGGALALRPQDLDPAVVAESLVERPVSSGTAGGWLAPLVTIAIMTPFFWWTMHFLLDGRIRWRTLLPSAVITGVFYGGLGVFSKFYFSETIISDSKTYGTIGAIFGIMTWFIAIGAVIILGAVAGAVWEDRGNQQIPGVVIRP